MTVEVEDTYAEAFRSLWVEFLITARDRTWLDHAVNAATGFASSSIMCDCEAGVDRYVGPGGDETFRTPDGRPGAICQLHVPRFWKHRVQALEKALLGRVSQSVLPCPTARCFSVQDDPGEAQPYSRLGRKVAYFGGASGPLPDMDLSILASMGSLSVIRTTLRDYVRDAEEIAWRAGEMFALWRAGRMKIKIGPISS